MSVVEGADVAGAGLAHGWWVCGEVTPTRRG